MKGYWPSQHCMIQKREMKRITDETIVESVCFCENLMYLLKMWKCLSQLDYCGYYRQPGWRRHFNKKIGRIGDVLIFGFVNRFLWSHHNSIIQVQHRRNRT